MKWSNYNFLVDKANDCYLLYNCKRERVISLVKELKELIEVNKDRIDRLKEIHPELFHYLKDNEFIISDDFNEQVEVMREVDRNAKTSSCFHLIINPTMNCNVQCWYCYENHHNNTIMSESVLQSVKRLIHHQITSEKFKEFCLNFFGGEPLLEYHSVMLPLLLETERICNQAGIPYYISITTNGILLTKDVIDHLISFEKEIYIQIPFDGNRDIHNKIKKCIGKNDVSTYDVVLQNMKYALMKGINVLLRCNYSQETIGLFHELIEEVSHIDVESKKRLSIALKKIWQTEETEETLKIVEELGIYTTSCGIFDLNTQGLSGYLCYADKPSSIVVNYNGDIFKCTARDFVKEAREGVLKPDGTIEFNERYEERMEVKKENLACLNCNVLPICRGGCTQHHLELFQENTCPLGLSEQKKEKMIQKHLSTIICNV